MADKATALKKLLDLAAGTQELTDRQWETAIEDAAIAAYDAGATDDEVEAAQSGYDQPPAPQQGKTAKVPANLPN